MPKGVGKFKKKIFILTVFFVMAGILGILKKQEAKGVATEVYGGPIYTEGINEEVTSIPTEKQTALDEAERKKKEAEKKVEQAKTQSWYSMFDQAVQMFSQQFAYQTATKIAEGGQGGEALNWSIPWSDYMKEAALSAAGDFIGSLSKKWGVDLCDPGTLGKLSFTMNLVNDITRPPKPRCDWKDIKDNWRKLGEDEYLKKLSVSFNPDVNDLGNRFILETELERKIREEQEKKEKQRGLKIDEGVKDKVSKISNWINTPSTIISKQLWEPMENARAEKNSRAIVKGFMSLKSVWAPFTETFVSTLAAKLMEKYLNQGLFSVNAYKLAQNWNIIKDPQSSGTTVASKQATADYYKDFIKPQFSPGGNRDILSDLASCPFPENPGPTNCVLEANFRMAIEEKLTVGAAIKAGKLDEGKIFGFISAEKEPLYNEGYPYRAMRILRKYRILPVGWEIAAEYINNSLLTRGEKTSYTLGEMIECYDPADEWGDFYDEWCHGLVDPGWLLKVPANYCDKEGYGDEIVNEDFVDGIDANKDGFYYDKVHKPESDAELDDQDMPPKRIVSRNKFCAAEKSCLNETAEGKCLNWGHCIEERPIWRFNGEQCDRDFNSCQTVTRANTPLTPLKGGNVKNTPLVKGGTIQPISYLKNTLDYAGCEAENAGCNWYCAEGNFNRVSSSVDWLCAANGTPPVPPVDALNNYFFDRDVKVCEQENEGCRKFIRLNSASAPNAAHPYGELGTNLIYNSGFEKGTTTEIALANLKDKFNGWPIEKVNAQNVVKAQRETEKIQKGNYSYKIFTDGNDNGLFSFSAMGDNEKAYSLLPEGYKFDYEKAYIFSANIYVETSPNPADSKFVKLGIANSFSQLSKETANQKINEWERVWVYLPPKEFVADKIYIHSAQATPENPLTFYVDNVMLVEADCEGINQCVFPEYKDYDDADDNVYIKKAPSYLDCKNLPNPPQNKEDEAIIKECSKYATECRSDEVGCAKYTPVNKEPWVPAIVSAEDFCDKECVNYKSYTQKATNFTDELANINFIADNQYLTDIGGTICPAEEAGCTEFTNLDELEKGGEAREYYTELKQCVKQDEQDVSCVNFYTWEGSDTAGYQLKNHYLQKDANGAPKQRFNPQDLGKCSGPEDLKSNSANCRQFYNKEGKEFYVLHQNTITCSEDCHPYRRTRENIQESGCAVYGSKWLNIDNTKTIASITELSELSICSGQNCVCQLEIENCLYSGGKWTNNECIYKAIPEQGQICSNSNVGCFEYKGTTNGNVKVILIDNFEDGTNSGWIGGISSSQATIVGGKSLTLQAQANVMSKDLKGVLDRTKTYKISFLAANTSENKVELLLRLKGIDFFAQRSMAINSSEWRQYETGLIVLSGDLNEDGLFNDSDLEILKKAAANKMNVTARQRELADLNGDGSINNNDIVLFNNKGTLPSYGQQLIEIAEMKGIYLDNIVIKAVQDDIYRIKDSWNVPSQCDSPTIGAQLGCAEYTDAKGHLLQLNSFHKLCSSNAIGCEQMIDTYNSENLFEERWNITQTPSKPSRNIIVPRDKMVYFVNNPEKYCLKESKGCQRLGVPHYNQDKTGLNRDESYYGDVFLINDPDQYNDILCAQESLECEEYQYSLGNEAGVLYFKDPKDKICENKNGIWYKFGTAELCPVVMDIAKTLGGIAGLRIELPINGWAGVCPAEQSGCTEYLDPLSNNQENIVFNGNFEQDAQARPGSPGDGPDGWEDIQGCGAGCPECCFQGYGNSKAVRAAIQNLDLFDDTLYTISARVMGTGSITISDCVVFSPDGSIITNTNNKTGVINSGVINFIDYAKMKMLSGRFYVDSLSNSGSCKLALSSTNGFIDEVKVQETDVYYYLASTIDKGKCAGVNFDEGCVLINERSFAPPVGTKELVYSVDKAFNKETNIMCSNNECANSANEIMKVTPDRICGKWLYAETTAKTAEGANVVYELGECTAATLSGACLRSVRELRENRNFSSGSVDLMKNIAGISRVGFKWLDGTKVEGYYPVSAMLQKGQFIEFNGGFEKASREGEPYGWTYAWKGTGKGSSDWKQALKVIDNPVEAQGQERLEPRAPVGKNFLKIKDNYAAVLEEGFIIKDETNYIISGYINSKNLLSTSAKAGIYITTKDSAGGATQIYNSKDKLVDEIALAIEPGQNWIFLAEEFKTSDSAKRLFVSLENRGGKIEGNSYFDEVSLNAALKVKTPDETASLSRSTSGEKGFASVLRNGISPSVCKIYAKEDSLACEYMGENNIYYKGERGYCLEYDRPPGNPNVCINWFPVDVIRGEEGKSIPPFNYASHKEGPLYYCLEGEFLESRHIALWSHNGSQCLANGYCAAYHRKSLEFWRGPEYWRWCIPNERAVAGAYLDWPYYTCDQETGSGDISTGYLPPNWFYYNGALDELKNAAAPYQEKFKVRCTKVVQVVKANGESLPWAKRLSSDSDYKVPHLFDPDMAVSGDNYSYSSDLSPYGAIWPPEATFENPESWDADAFIEKNQPLEVIPPKWVWSDTDGKFIPRTDFEMETPRAGLPYSCSNLNYPDQGCVAPWNMPNGGLKVEIKNNIIEAQDALRGLFAKSYDGWQWSDVRQKYEKISNFTWKYKDANGNIQIQTAKALWESPDACPSAERASGAICAVVPRISNIKMEKKSSGNILLGIAGSILFQFNSNVNEEQQPMTGYTINWGDGDSNGADKIRITPQPSWPHSFSHEYNYVDLKKAVTKAHTNSAACLSSSGTSLCCFEGDSNTQCVAYGVDKGADCCMVRPRVQIKDNWGWCSQGTNTDKCPGKAEVWDKYDGWIVVSEK